MARGPEQLAQGAEQPLRVVRVLQQVPGEDEVGLAVSLRHAASWEWSSRAWIVSTPAAGS